VSTAIDEHQENHLLCASELWWLCKAIQSARKKKAHTNPKS